MNETQFARSVALTLDAGLRQLDSSTSARLSAARHQALARQKRVTVRVGRFAGLAGVFQRHILRFRAAYHASRGLFLHQLVAAQIEGTAYPDTAGAGLYRADPFALLGAIEQRNGF